MTSVAQLMQQLTDPSAEIESPYSSEPMRELQRRVREGGLSLDESIEILTALRQPLRLEEDQYKQPASTLILYAVAANPVPACADALVAVADDIPEYARGSLVRCLFRIGVAANHDPAVVAGFDLLDRWARTLDAHGAGGVFFFLRGQPDLSHVVVPRLGGLDSDDTLFRREIETVRTVYRTAGLVPADVTFEPLYTVDYLRAVAESEPDDLASIVIDQAEARVPIQGSRYDTIAAMPALIQHVYAAWWLEAEVLNGGLEQYFWNSSGEFAVEAVEALDAFDLQQLADVLKAAIVAQMAAEDQWRPLRSDGSLEAFSASYELGTLDGIGHEFDRVYSEAPISQALSGALSARLEELSAFLTATSP